MTEIQKEIVVQSCAILGWSAEKRIKNLENLENRVNLQIRGLQERASLFEEILKDRPDADDDFKHELSYAIGTYKKYRKISSIALLKPSEIKLIKEAYPEYPNLAE